MPADIGMVGLGVMGRNLVLNMADHGHRAAVQDLSPDAVRAFVQGPGAAAGVSGHETLAGLVADLRSPRVVMLMVPAGAPVDVVIDELAPLLDPGDVIVDGGNSHHADTARRGADLRARGVRFVGMGVSGGEDGARYGPSLMPGGDAEAWPLVRELFQAIAATADDGSPCCDWIGPGSAGHFVKMVHNGIEYGDMQVIAEAYDLMRSTGRSNAEMAEVFEAWDRGVLDSFLVEITAAILAFTDPARGGEATVDAILDAAGQKGTGKWAAIASLEGGQPLTLVAEAVYARIVSAFKEDRVAAAPLLDGPDRRLSRDALDLDDLRDALHASKIVSYAQGFMLLRAAGEEHGWDLDLGRIASLWRAGCIIRAALLEDITAAFAEQPDLGNLLLADRFRAALSGAQGGWRRTVAAGTAAGVPLPAYSSALAFYDAARSERLPANLLQAQRDYFGAHTYERTDTGRGESFHTDWTGAS